MSYRKIEVNGREWQWKVGKSFLDIRSPEGKGYRPKKEQVGQMAERDPDDPFMGSAIAVGTGDVRRYIEGIRA